MGKGSAAFTAVISPHPPLQLTLPAGTVAAGATIVILVESCGHINYGHGMWDPKGLQSPVTLDGETLAATWSVYTLPMEGAAVQSLSWGSGTVTGPGFFRGVLTIATGGVADTWWSSAGWGKGFVVSGGSVPARSRRDACTSRTPPPPPAQLINGFNVGRFWQSQGPQHALYVPAPLLREGANDVIVFNQPEAGQAQPTAPTANWFDGPMLERAPLEFPAPSQVAPRALRSELPAAANASAGAACTTTPQPGLILTLQSCASAGAAATQWNWVTVNALANAAALQLAAAPALCVAMNGTNPASGYPYLILDVCTPGLGDAGQHWLHMTPTGGQVRPVWCCAAVVTGPPPPPCPPPPNGRS